MLQVLKRSEVMGHDRWMQNMQDRIEKKRNQLNNMILSNINKEQLLKYSMELDKLINDYYSELNKNRADK